MFSPSLILLVGSFVAGRVCATRYRSSGERTSPGDSRRNNPKAFNRWINFLLPYMAVNSPMPILLDCQASTGSGFFQQGNHLSAGTSGDDLDFAGGIESRLARIAHLSIDAPHIVERMTRLAQPRLKAFDSFDLSNFLTD